LGNRTGGRVQVEVAYGSVMGPPPKHYDLAVTGEADISHVGIPYTPGRFPMAEVLELPLARAPESTYTKAYWELYKRGYFDNDFKDVKVLYLAAVGPYDYHMAVKPVRTFEDMKGLKIRASGKGLADIVSALGSVPVGMPAPEIYVSLEKGVIDGAAVTFSFMNAFRTESVTKYVTRVGSGAMGMAWVMNKATYEKLPADIRKTIDELGDKYNVKAGESYDYFTDVGANLFRGVNGQIFELSAADMQKVDAAMAPIWQKWIADGEAKGLPRKKMVDDLYNILKGLGVEKPFHGYAP
jgi:TRAP-type C4-dicarboxylate transport system substrate-binding protein